MLTEQQPSFEGDFDVDIIRVAIQAYENGAHLLPNGYGKMPLQPVTPVTSCPDIVLGFLWKVADSTHLIFGFHFDFVNSISLWTNPYNAFQYDVYRNDVLKFNKHWVFAKTAWVHT